MSLSRVMLWLSLIGLLTSCAELRPAPAPAIDATPVRFALRGSVSVITPKKIFIGRIYWQHTPHTNEIVLYAPLGDRVATLYTSKTSASLRDAHGRELKARTAEMLIEQALGWRLPLSRLSNWVVAHAISAENRMPQQSFTQDGWQLRYDAFMQAHGMRLPRKLLLKNNDLELKLVIHDWIFIATE